MVLWVTMEQLTHTPFAEIAQSSLRTWSGQCWQWDVMPAYGSLVAVESGDLVHYGIVYHLTTGSHDGQRTVYAYQKTHEQLKKEHPHIFEFLSSTVCCLTLGYTRNNAVFYTTPPQPPLIHAFMSQPNAEQTRSFLSDERYLHMLFSHTDQIDLLDDLLCALIPTLVDYKILSQARLEKLIHTYSLLTANDYRRLKLFLQRIQPLVQSSSPTSAKKMIQSLDGASSINIV